MIVAQEVVAGFTALHERSLLHNDIHEKNVLRHPVNNIVKVIDFGKACRVDRPHVHNVARTEREARWDIQHPNFAYEIRKVPMQPSTQITDTFSIGFLLRQLGYCSGQQSIKDLDCRMSTDDVTS